jgi:GTPase Era involved in 16S rRNA processing
MYLRNTDLVLCCCECNDYFAFDQFGKMIQECKEVSPNANFLLVFTKMDKYFPPTLRDASNLSASWQYADDTIIYTSSETGEGVDDLLKHINVMADRNLEEYDKYSAGKKPSKKAMGGLDESLLEHPIQLKSSHFVSKKKKKCCVIS